MSTATVNRLESTDGTYGVDVKDISSAMSDTAGYVFNWAGTTAPSGSLECLGQEVAIVDYPELYASIGDTWATTISLTAPAEGLFRLPPSSKDGLGLYTRGVGQVGVGVYQVDVFKEHFHQDFAQRWASSGNLKWETSGTNMRDSYKDGGKTGDVTETRPRSITMMMCIVTGKGILQRPQPAPIQPAAVQMKIKRTMQTDKVDRTFSTTWANGKEWDTYTKRVGSVIKLGMEVPARNDDNSWGGGYMSVSLSINGGAYVVMGNFGYGSLNIMHLSTDSIGRNHHELLLDTQEVLDATTIRIRFSHRAYTGSLLINKSCDVNGGGSTPNPLYADQFFSQLIIEEF